MPKTCPHFTTDGLFASVVAFGIWMTWFIADSTWKAFQRSACLRMENKAAQSTLTCSHHQNRYRGGKYTSWPGISFAASVCHPVKGMNSRRWQCCFQALKVSSAEAAFNRWVKWRKNGALFILINPAGLWAFFKVCEALIRVLSSMYYINWLLHRPSNQLVFLATVPRQ